MNAPFYVRETASEAVKDLLLQTTLGTEGATYQHLNTDEILQQLDKPLFLSLERGNSALGNVTFCRRQKNWYIRYFTFAKHLHTSKKGTDSNKSTGTFKKKVDAFFQEKLDQEADSFYAYVDPKNLKSKWMCENFGFKKIGELTTQSFSRYSPKSHPGFEVSENTTEIQSLIERHKDHLFFTNYNASRCKYALIRSAQGEIIAFAKYQTAHWRIHRLPGRMGKWQARFIPFLPHVSRIFNPKNHRFIVPESILIKENDHILLAQLFESILAHEKHNLLIWWADSREPLLTTTRSQVDWGLFHKLLGRPPVSVYSKFLNPDMEEKAKEHLLYVSGMDLI